MAGSDVLSPLFEEVKAASPPEIRAYLSGAARDGYVSKLHGTLRISQANEIWISLVCDLLTRIGLTSWRYREGQRSVFVAETGFNPIDPRSFVTLREKAAFARGYFDAEGGIPQKSEYRFYIQLVQKDRTDLETLRGILGELEIACGRIHNPSVRADPDYWRFYVLAQSHAHFIERVGSWHPRKRRLLEDRRSVLVV